MEAEIRDGWKICVVTQNHKGINDNQEDNAVFKKTFPITTANTCTSEDNLPPHQKRHEIIAEKIITFC